MRNILIRICGTITLAVYTTLFIQEFRLFQTGKPEYTFLHAFYNVMEIVGLVGTTGLFVAFWVWVLSFVTILYFGIVAVVYPRRYWW